MKVVPGNGRLSLQNDGDLEIFFIGVGSAFARTLFQTNFLIVKGDTHIMVDFGMTGPAALRETAGLEPTDIQVVFPTHSHADHVGGIECLGLINRYVGMRFLSKPKIQMIIDEEYQELLWSMTLKGGLAYNEILEGGRDMVLEDYFDLIRPERLSDRHMVVEHGGVKLEVFRTCHIPEQAGSWANSMISYGLFIDDRVFVSVDTQYDRELIDTYAARSEVMFHDVQFFPKSVHAPFEDLQTLPPEIKEKMYFIHYPDDRNDYDISGFAGFAQQGHRYIFP